MALTLASLFAPKHMGEESAVPTVQVLVAARNEEGSLGRLFRCLELLDYPPEKLSFILVSDGSQDQTAAMLQAWCAARKNAQSIELKQNLGKAAALEIARRAAPSAELTAIYDADVYPEPAALRRLAMPFADPAIGGTTGVVLPDNAGASMVSRYAALELYVFHLVVQASRNRLGWNPPLIGANCMYRSEALAQIGGFQQEISEDVATSFAVIRRGWRTSSRQDAVVRTQVPETLGWFWRQRQRWTRGLYRSAGNAVGFTSWMVAAGYADRLVLLAVAVAAIFGMLSPYWLLIYFLGPCLAVLIALRRSGESGALSFLAACPPMFVVDVLSTVAGTMASLRPGKSKWLTKRG